jgi:hypothetical protein
MIGSGGPALVALLPGSLPRLNGRAPGCRSQRIQPHRDHVATGLTSEEYVSQKGWLAASLERCPFHPEGGCGLARHGTYARVWPAGCLIARWRCPPARTTISLLPDFLCSRLRGTLAEVEAVVAAVEAAPTQEAASEALRPDIELPGALRWLRRSRQLVYAGSRPPSASCLDSSRDVGPPSPPSARRSAPRSPSSAFTSSWRRTSARCLRRSVSAPGP